MLSNLSLKSYNMISFPGGSNGKVSTCNVGDLSSNMTTHRELPLIKLIKEIGISLNKMKSWEFRELIDTTLLCRKQSKISVHFRLHGMNWIPIN